MSTTPNSPIDPVQLDVSFRPQRWHIEVSVSHARANLPELLEDVRAGGVVYLTRYGRRLAALVPAGAAERLERAEDDYWSRRAQDALSGDEPSIPWEQVVAELEAGP
jgi:prevent-host-death family protein